MLYCYSKCQYSTECCPYSGIYRLLCWILHYKMCRNVFLDTESSTLFTLSCNLLFHGRNKLKERHKLLTTSKHWQQTSETQRTTLRTLVSEEWWAVSTVNYSVLCTQRCTVTADRQPSSAGPLSTPTSSLMVVYVDFSIRFSVGVDISATDYNKTQHTPITDLKSTGG